MNVRRLIRHPVSIVAGLVGAVATVLQVPFAVDLISWLVASSGTLFTATSIFAFTIAPEVAPSIEPVLVPIAVSLGVIFAVSRLHKAGKKLLERL